jgi:hypothetical protein
LKDEKEDRFLSEAEVAAATTAASPLPAGQQAQSHAEKRFNKSSICLPLDPVAIVELFFV